MVIQALALLKKPLSINLYKPLFTRLNGSPFGRENLPQTTCTSPAYATSEK